MPSLWDKITKQMLLSYCFVTSMDLGKHFQALDIIVLAGNLGMEQQ